jgi:hypothetical protein
VALGIALAAISGSVHAAATQSVSFDVSRGPGAERCPDYEALARLWSRRPRRQKMHRFQSTNCYKKAGDYRARIKTIVFDGE